MPSDTTPPPTARLAFREMTPADLDEMAALLGDPGVMAYYPRPKTRAEAAAACRDYARTVLHAGRMVAIIYPDNRPSQRVPEKRALVHGGREAVIYAMTLEPR